MLQNLGEGAAVGGLLHIPSGDLDPQTAAKIGGTAAHPTKCADDQRVGRGEPVDLCREVAGQRIGVGIGRDGGDSLPTGLGGPAFDGHRRPREPCPIAKGGDASACLVGQILKVQQGAAARLETL